AHRNRGAERGLDDRDLHLRVDVVAIPNELGVGLDEQLHVEIARRSALGSALAGAGDPQGLAVGHAGGNLDLEGARLLNGALAAAGPAGALDALTLAAT